jgi:hypothetical protein
MSGTLTPELSVSSLFAEREARRQQDRQAEEQLVRKREEELLAFKKRLEDFELTQDRIQSALYLIKRAFERGETELMISSFPSDFCTDGGRAVINVGAPPINKPSKEEAAAAKEREPEWVGTMPAGVRVVYEYWKQSLKPGGFAFSARVIDYPDGKPGNIGLFISWPKSAMDAPV